MLVLFDNKLQNVHVLPNLMSVDYATPDSMRLRHAPVKPAEKIEKDPKPPKETKPKEQKKDAAE